MVVVISIKKGNKANSSLQDVMRTLNELASVARSGDIHEYRRLVKRADELGITEDQIKDSYKYGRRDIGDAEFNYRGMK